MEIIYIVVGSTGKYADYAEWNVKAFRNRRDANLFAIECKTYAKDFMEDKTITIKSPDDFFEMDYTGTWYNIKELELN